MKKHLISTLALLCIAIVSPATNLTTYTPEDSTKVITLLHKATTLKENTNLMLYFARQLKGIPYVAKTLEINNEERLIVNLRQLDCTTYVETITALTLCATNKQYTFEGFCHYLQQIRYEKGQISYPNRLHYFSSWIKSNTEKGFVKEICKPNPPFCAIQVLNINFMTTHTELYPMFARNNEWIKQVRRTEQSLTGKHIAYIPKNKIYNTQLMRKTIHDGDIIAINTSKKGLDTSHIGIAVWHSDGLHLLNASQIHGKVVEEPMTLRTYMSKHPSQTGIRIIRMKCLQQ